MRKAAREKEHAKRESDNSKSKAVAASDKKAKYTNLRWLTGVIRFYFLSDEISRSICFIRYYSPYISISRSLHSYRLVHTLNALIYSPSSSPSSCCNRALWGTKVSPSTAAVAAADDVFSFFFSVLATTFW